ncbi:alpha/beta fold hydrolase [Rhodococcus sp. F64268]|uniref:alpha/beta fold hydrolase n=1 Tax=Rhodococcus sp. F64268 TaxID=2926402 RepID=UPI001FF3D05D|nr:alpha/beta fold hydrolase [Rhodococcus sp. F64268]MCK0093246.1 alpha/beta fold hydrolase [Rhodococcus sp. F64268]
MKFARRIAVATATAALAASASLVTTPAMASAQPTTDQPPSAPAAGDGRLAALLSTMGPSPAGTNDLDCVPSTDHPRPVVLVHGTGSGMMQTWPIVAPQLADLGYCVYALNYGGAQAVFDPDKTIWGVTDIEQSAVEIRDFVDAVLEHTGSDKVDLVGHSQGGMLSRQYLKFEGGADPLDPARNKVENLIMLGATNHGTSFNGLQQLYAMLAIFGLTNGNDIVAQALFAGTNLGVAGQQQLIGSRVLAALNDGPETLPGIKYTSIATRHDEIVTPPESSFLESDAGATVENKWVQDLCPTSPADHSTMLMLPESLYLVKSALDPAYADVNEAPCTVPEAPGTP